MPWTPTESVINARAIADNLFTFFATNQADAFTWAGDSSLKPVRKFSNSVANRAVPVYPAMAFVSDNDAVDYAASEAAQGGYSVTLEFSVQNTDPDTAVTQARVYAKAFASMIVNIGTVALLANTGAVVSAAARPLDTLEIGFDPIRANEQQNDFLQVFQIRVTYLLMAGN